MLRAFSFMCLGFLRCSAGGSCGVCVRRMNSSPVQRNNILVEFWDNLCDSTKLLKFY